MKLHTTRSEFDQLHYAVDNSKRGIRVTIMKQALTNLLMDHGAMCAKLKINDQPTDGSDLA